MKKKNWINFNVVKFWSLHYLPLIKDANIHLTGRQPGSDLFSASPSKTDGEHSTAQEFHPSADYKHKM